MNSKITKSISIVKFANQSGFQAALNNWMNQQPQYNCSVTTVNSFSELFNLNESFPNLMVFTFEQARNFKNELSTIHNRFANVTCLMECSTQNEAEALRMFPAMEVFVNSHAIGHRYVNFLNKWVANKNLTDLDFVETNGILANKHFENTPSMKTTIEVVKKAMMVDTSVLINGEKGIGKRQIAEQIHNNSRRKSHPFVFFNTELFQPFIDQLLFTSNKDGKKSYFEKAEKGTLFINNIDRFNNQEQSKLLRILQEKRLYNNRQESVPVNVRLIVSSTKNLFEEVANGRFKEELLNRINGVQIEIPALRNRGMDVVLLSQFFAKNTCQNLSIPTKEITPEASKRLLAYSFPENITELKMTIEKAVILSKSNKINAEDIQFEGVSKSSEHFLDTERKMIDYKNRIIHHFLKKYDEDIITVAQKLDIGKSTIYRMLKNEKDQKIRERQEAQQSQALPSSNLGGQL